VTSDSIGRDPVRSIGLYVVSLAGAERSFCYWRDSSAARRLADDADALLAAVTVRGAYPHFRHRACDRGR